MLRSALSLHLTENIQILRVICQTMFYWHENFSFWYMSIFMNWTLVGDEVHNSKNNELCNNVWSLVVVKIQAKQCRKWHVLTILVDGEKMRDAPPIGLHSFDRDCNRKTLWRCDSQHDHVDTERCVCLRHPVRRWAPFYPNVCRAQTNHASFVDFLVQPFVINMDN